MTNPQTEARVLLDGMRKHTAFLNSQEQDAIVDVIATALAAKDAELDVQAKLYRLALQDNRRLADALKRAEAQLAEARKALEPFALVAEHGIGKDEADSDALRPMPINRAPQITVGHIRAARRALEGGE